mmetsp:Transcript_118891/g.341514  ORF Transcript_118891/g.341514 Transcript_118891/m.341514 type:complete len:238 (-) Transcript_118891:1940-2653(-)
MLGPLGREGAGMSPDGVLDEVHRHDAARQLPERRDSEGGARPGVPQALLAVRHLRPRPGEESARDHARGAHDDHGRRAEATLEEAETQDATQDAGGPIGATDKHGDLVQAQATLQQYAFHSADRDLVNPHELLDLHILTQEITDGVLPADGAELENEAERNGDDDAASEADAGDAPPLSGDDDAGGDVHGDARHWRQHEHGEANPEENKDDPCKGDALLELLVQPCQEDHGDLGDAH